MRVCEALPVLSTRCVGSSFRSTFLTFAPPSETSIPFSRSLAGSPAGLALESCGPFFRRALRHLPVGGAGFHAALADFLSWGFPKIPSIDITPCVRSGLGPLSRAAPGRRGCRPSAPSALAVLPGCSGFLRMVARRFVAPCCRSWGSARSGCRSLARLAPPELSTLRSLPPLQPAVPRRRGPCPLSSFTVGLASRPPSRATSGSCSGEESSPSRRPCSLPSV